MTAPSAHHAALRAPLSAPLAYPLRLRLYDGFVVGRRDADTSLAHEPVSGRQPSASLRRLDAELGERCERELWQATAQAAPLIDRRGEILHALPALRAQVDALRARIEAGSASSDAELNRVSATEAHLAPAVVRARRQREAAARLAAPRAQLAALEARIGALEGERAQLEGWLTTLFDGLVTRARALANLYERRAGTLVRSYLRRTPAPDAHRHPLNARAPFAPPAWSSGPNPWLSSAAEAVEGPPPQPTV
ncbi:hypothetical protein [Microbacterium sp. 10M-3C3]|jgi:hypothetical protein|uniref:hypothetical protein n=1 Tax=Microbacterium sp. 10M-3C3 TaxID=2483401 RepID=UPI000F63B574|nr:hypothetical protein [Microbacterium sp. 10M-3C3]